VCMEGRCEPEGGNCAVCQACIVRDTKKTIGECVNLSIGGCGTCGTCAGGTCQRGGGCGECQVCIGGGTVDASCAPGADGATCGTCGECVGGACQPQAVPLNCPPCEEPLCASNTNTLECFPACDPADCCHSACHPKCDSGQTRDPILCGCRSGGPGACADPCPPGTIQDPVRCTCREVCEPCPLGQVRVDPQTCDCGCDPCPNPEQTQDLSTCNCTCPSTSCPDGKQLNSACDCVCSPKSCDGGKGLNPESCECECAPDQEECEGDGSCYPTCTAQRSRNPETCKCDCNGDLADCGEKCCEADRCLRLNHFPTPPPICCPAGPACQDYAVCCGAGEECTDVDGCCQSEWVCKGLSATSCCDPNEGRVCQPQSDGEAFCVRP
jgi:hypothetical protein